MPSTSHIVHWVWGGLREEMFITTAIFLLERKKSRKDLKLATLRLGNGESRCNWMLFFPPHAGLTANKCLSNSPTVLTFRLLKLFPLLLNLKTATWQILALVSGQSMIFIGLRSDHCIVSPGLETWMMWLWEWCQQLDDVFNTMVATKPSKIKL